MTLLLCSNEFSGRETTRHASSQLFTGSDCGTVDDCLQKTIKRHAVLFDLSEFIV